MEADALTDDAPVLGIGLWIQQETWHRFSSLRQLRNFSKLVIFERPIQNLQELVDTKLYQDKGLKCFSLHCW